MKKTLVVIAVLTLIVPVFVFASVAYAQPIGLNYAANLGLASTDQDPRVMAVNVVKFLMTFLGIIAVTVILLGGFKWMTASGNDDKVQEAKKLIMAGIIGLIIILSAYAIVQYIISTTTGLITTGEI
jgi:hypothetical protein